MSTGQILIQETDAAIHVKCSVTGQVYNLKPALELINELISFRARGPNHIDSAISNLGELSGDIMHILNSDSPTEALKEASEIHSVLSLLKQMLSKMKVE